MYVVGNHDVLIVATQEPRLPSPDWSVLALPGIAHDMKRVLTLTPEMLDALRVVEARTLAPLVHRGGANSDFYPVLDLGAERTRYLAEGATGFAALSGDRFGLATLLEERRVPVSKAPYIVIGNVPRLEAMELAARVNGGAFDGATIEQLTAAEAVRAVDRSLAANATPIDWRYWVDAVRRAEEARAGGSAGVADSAFYARVNQFLARQPAPAEARASIDFLHGLAARDFAEAARASQPLLAAAARGDFWLSPDLLREGAVIARLRAGDIAGARDAFMMLAPASSRGPDDLRGQLLAASIVEASQHQRAAARATPSSRSQAQ
jgi:hypothetical protein